MQGIPDKVILNEDFRELIDFTIANADKLKNFKHMGKLKYASIRLRTYNEFVRSVTELVARIREWYKENTVSLFHLYCDHFLLIWY
jgi:hypothetical protein